jgi:GNAT superfamily N-acetyltransferase
MKDDNLKCSFEVFEEKDIDNKMDRNIRSLLCECYPEDVGIYKKTRYWNGIKPVFSLIYFTERKIAGYVGVVIREVLRKSELLTVAGIQNLAVSPGIQGRGVGKELVSRAQNEAVNRGLSYGMLFCEHSLEEYYISMGWSRAVYPVVMDDGKGNDIPLPNSLIAMVKVFGIGIFPSGDITLRGKDW